MANTNSHSSSSSSHSSSRPTSSTTSLLSSIKNSMRNFINSFLFSIQQLYHPKPNSSPSNSLDINFLITTILLIISLLFPWILILAFLSLLPAIYTQLLQQTIPLPPPQISTPTAATTASTSSSTATATGKPKRGSNANDIISPKDIPSEGTPNTPEKPPSSTSSPSANSLNEKVNCPPSGGKQRKIKKKLAKEEWGLPTLRVIDSNGKIVPVNPGTPTPMETDCFKGFILIMLKCDGEYEDYDRYQHHFKGKQRKFEVQFQGQMKFVPKGEVILGGELADRMQVSFVTRSLLSFLMKFAMSLNPFLHFGFGDEPKSDGNYELPHLTFPLFRVMDRVVVTPPGETPPELGKELPEVDSDRILRRSGKGPHMSFQEGYTYSFSFHSMYVDFSRWSICNFPGYRAIDLRGFFGQQKVKVVCYELVDSKKDENGRTSTIPHYNSNKHYLLSLEMSHTCMMTNEELAAANQEVVEEEKEEMTTTGTTTTATAASTTTTTTAVSSIGLKDTRTADEEQDEEEENENENGVTGAALASSSTTGVAAAATTTTTGNEKSTNNVEMIQSEPETETEREMDDDSSSSESEEDLPDNEPSAPTEQIDNPQVESEDETSEVLRSNSCGSLGTGAEYVTANSVVSLISIPPPWDTGSQKNESEDSDNEDTNRYADCYISVADVSGAALRKECTDTPIIRFVRPQTVNHLSLSVRKLTNLRKTFAGNHKSNATRSEEFSIDQNHNKVLCSGDEVMIQCASTGRYLTIHRGWWISWTAEDTGSKCLFSIQMMGPTGLSYALKGTKLIAGKPFRLRSVRWSDWEVGYDGHTGVRTGQQMLLYQSKMLRNRMAKNAPVKWGKNNKLVNPLCLCVLPEMNSTIYPDSTVLANDNQPEGLAPALSPSLVLSDRQSPQQPTLPFLDIDNEDLDLPLGFELQLSGWVEVFNRSLNHPQLAYCVQVKCSIRGEIKQWTTFRTQRDFDDLFAIIPQDSKSPSLPQQQLGLDDTQGIEIHGSEIIDNSGGHSPSITSAKKLTLPKRSTNFSTVSARHQCSPDQSVHLMSLRLKVLLGDQLLPVMQRTAEQSGKKSSQKPLNNETNPTTTSSQSPSISPTQDLKDSEDSIHAPSELSIDPREAMYEESEDFPTVSISDLSKTRIVFLKSLSKRSLLDVWFLQPPIDGGIEKYLSPTVLKRAVRTSIVSRALWDTHWREEIAVLYPTHVAFYPPMAKKASWTLSLQELIGISHVPDDKSPIIGKSILKIETIGRVHYLAFPSKEACNSLSASILEYFSGVTFENSLPSYVDTTDPRDRFVLKSGRWRPSGRRLILNARKLTFDLESQPMDETYWEFSARLLKTVFQLDRNNSIRLSPETLKSEQTTRVTELDNIDVSFETNADGLFPGREKIISFLDDTVRLKLINLQDDIDLNSPEALCFFINIYHTLLIHARLVLNPPSTQDWSTFFENVSYEIGGDVFSLSELEHCVIGGKLERPFLIPKNFCPPPLLQDDHYSYALHLADRRVRFVLNYCSVSTPNTIHILKPENIFSHLNEASVALFEYSLQVDLKKRIVTLPKLCEIFRNDFGNNSQEVLRHILRYLERDHWEKVSMLLNGSKLPVVKFHEMECRSHDSLQLIA